MRRAFPVSFARENCNLPRQAPMGFSPWRHPAHVFVRLPVRPGKPLQNGRSLYSAHIEYANNTLMRAAEIRVLAIRTL